MGLFLLVIMGVGAGGGVGEGGGGLSCLLSRRDYLRPVARLQPCRKMQPAVIFMDEIDSMLTSRSAGEHEALGVSRVLHCFAQFLASCHPCPKIPSR